MTNRATRLVFSMLLGVGCALAGEYAVFDNGSRLLIDSHEPAGDRWRLRLNGGQVELPADRVVAFEPESTLPQRPPATGTAEAPAAQKPDPRSLVNAVAQKYGLPPAFLHSVVAVESGYNPGAVSPKGAIGLMQLMPATARELNADPRDVKQNVDAGAQYLADLLRKYGDTEMALAAYNAGQGAVDRHRGIPPYPETQSYVEQVKRNWLKSNRKP